ncbi:DUF1007 family protein [Sulfurimonas lithotrophica]|uniref:Nickel/cobalt efflux system n=1 Tax=Sulfurimonas lithotrophica TaxID=2590022 RepID=A0A5P8P1J0_9BACT|nr:DUF1007 family protein [Sulfurimonas lithotrophica]QFR49481.1 DUF1007 family protein [Sulfurimonas lithotrophica]
MTIKTIIFTALLSYNLFACATCALMVPTAEVKLQLDIKDKSVKNIHFVWEFSDIYIDEIRAQYDKNKNSKLDKEELDIILDIKNNYLQNKNMLSKIKLIDSNENSKTLSPVYENFSLHIKNNQLIYTFDGKVDASLQEKSRLSFVFEDDEAFFSFVVTDINTTSKEPFYEANPYLFTANILFSYSGFNDKKIQVQKKNKTVDASSDINKTLVKEKLSQENILKKSIEKIKSLFESIKDESNPLTYISLLLFAYIYGVVHALGPGHGKTLVASYFLTNDKSYLKALFISLAIGVVHTFSAFFLTLAIYFFIDALFAQFIDNAVFYTTKISALIIIFIAVYLLLKKHKLYKELAKPKFTFSTAPHPQTCGCGSCKVDKDSTDAALIISAGIIPCPGTITIFIFSLSLGLYYAGFLSALVMSLGMSTIIFLSAVLSVYMRKKTDTNLKVKKFLEYGSLSIILILGLILLIG